MNEAQATQYAIYAGVAFLIWKFGIKKLLGRWQAAMAQMWTWEAFICALVWDVFLFGLSGVLMFVWVQVGGDLVLSMPDPTAPIKAASGKKG